MIWQCSMGLLSIQLFLSFKIQSSGIQIANLNVKNKKKTQKQIYNNIFWWLREEKCTCDIAHIFLHTFNVCNCIQCVDQYSLSKTCYIHSGKTPLIVFVFDLSSKSNSPKTSIETPSPAETDQNTHEQRWKSISWAWTSNSQLLQQGTTQRTQWHICS